MIHIAIRRLSLAVASIALTCTAAAAQDVLRQTVVVTAAAIPIELGSITRTLSVITREQIDSLPVSSVTDLLRLVASIDVRARGVRGIQADFSVRGAAFGQMLVLVDGVRINDAQSGHHNGDIPVALDAIERIEVLQGSGSSLFGADAFGGTINIITRREAPPSATIEAGSFDLVSARATGGFERGALRQTFAVSTDRSSGFTYERQFRTAGLNARSSIGQRSTVTAAYLWKDFGANGFYGNAPSHEWTNQTLLSGDHHFGAVANWQVDGALSYRTHGDHFLFNVQRPGVAENRHRTHTTLGSIKAQRVIAASGSIAAGLEAGSDWVRSTNLGNRSLRRLSGFGEWRYALARRAHVDASLRVDRYTEFGTSWSPAVGAGWWPTNAVRLRTSVGRAFRVPTFTERYYNDPANLARAEVGPEASWSGDGGADLFLGTGWLVQATMFGRKDRDVIDWLRATPSDRWQTYNVHHVATRGVELAIRRTFAGGAFLQAGYTALDLHAAAITLLSKYILEYAPHTVVAAAAVPLPMAIRLAPRLEYKHRRRNANRFDYALFDVRLSRAFRGFELRVDGTNLGNTRYEEIAGVAMPGRAATVSIRVGG